MNLSRQGAPMKRPWFKWYPADYLQATLGLTLEQDGFYRRVLDAMWLNGGMVPVDEKKLAMLLRCSLKKTRNMEALLANYCTLVPKGSRGNVEAMWSQSRLDKEQVAYEKKCATNRKNAEKGAEARWNPPATTDAERHSERHSTEMPNGIHPPMPNGTPENALSQKSEARSQNKREEPPIPPAGVDSVRIPKADMMARVKFDEARAAFPGLKKGLDNEWENFKKKNKAYRATVFQLLPAILHEVEWRARGLSVGAFVPQWAHFSTWINQRRWEQELPEHITQNQQHQQEESDEAAIRRLEQSVK